MSSAGVRTGGAGVMMRAISDRDDRVSPTREPSRLNAVKYEPLVVTERGGAVQRRNNSPVSELNRLSWDPAATGAATTASGGLLLVSASSVVRAANMDPSALNAIAPAPTRSRVAMTSGSTG